ncbi:MAG: DUF5676 family membrane protein [Gammaproteobacteria bacterium]|nr:hypothetical protein [Pseudomonadales bacterium]MCP5347324.1 hypothetical protein [Pseudomonadales bacterium]
MRLDALKFGLAAGLAVAVVWLVISLLVSGMPGMSMNMGGYMMHSDFTAMSWHLGFGGFLSGGLLWIFIAGLYGWLLASLYNWLLAG